ncbi:hypothetical protein AB8880_10505 [Alphaproteobacteria bacterium LSUCC0684]
MAKIQEFYKKLQLVIAIIPLTLISEVSAETIISCGEAHGKAYYFPNTLDTSGRWVNDGYSGGVNRLIRESDGSYDIEFGAGKSIKNSGGNVILLSEGSTMIFLSLVLSTIELYIFDRGTDKLSILQYRTGLADKAATYIADC